MTLIKSGSVTHSVNMDQRFIELPFSSSGNLLYANLPVRASDTPPGFYLLFAIDAAGVPSRAKIIYIDVDTTPNVAVDYTPTVGGAGGGPFQLACAADETLVGVRGNFSTYVNQVGPRCVKVNQFGQWIGDPVDGALAGTTTTGTSFAKTCPRDFAVSGFRARASQYVDQLDFQCRALTASGGMTGTATYLGPVGGTGGTAQGPFACPTGNPAYALYGRSGSWLDNFGVQCRRASVTPVSVNSSPVIVESGRAVRRRRCRRQPDARGKRRRRRHADLQRFESAAGADRRAEHGPDLGNANGRRRLHRHGHGQRRFAERRCQLPVERGQRGSRSSSIRCRLRRASSSTHK